jgi:hypothetical protein
MQRAELPKPWQCGPSREQGRCDGLRRPSGGEQLPRCAQTPKPMPSLCAIVAQRRIILGGQLVGYRLVGQSPDSGRREVGQRLLGQFIQRSWAGRPHLVARSSMRVSGKSRRNWSAGPRVLARTESSPTQSGTKQGGPSRDHWAKLGRLQYTRTQYSPVTIALF